MARRTEDLKEIVITKFLIIKEIKIFALCFLIALMMNLFSILSYQTHWSELFTTLHITGVIAFIFYSSASIFRIILRLVKKLSSN